MTDSEKAILSNYYSKLSPVLISNPPTKPVRTMAEWEELNGVLIVWTSYTSILRQIVSYAQEECRVHIVCSDSSSVKTYLASGGVQIKNINFIIASYNSIWCRDYGPWSVYSDDVDSLYFIDWIYNRPRPLDDNIPSVLATKLSIPLYQTISPPNDLIHTGGNFMTDGFGTGFSSNLILDENSSKTKTQIDSILKRFMGIKRFIVMNNLPYDGIHHIDMHMKLLNEETILVGQYPTGVADGPQIEANIEYIKNNFNSIYDRPYKIVRILMPPDGSGKYPNSGGDYRTYTNSLIINKTVLVPTYETKYDTTALRIYRENMPGYKIVGINCNQIIGASGAIHCITKEIGVSNPVLILHIPFTDTVKSSHLTVKAAIKAHSGIESVILKYKNSADSVYYSRTMNETAKDTFSVSLPVNFSGQINYYFLVTDNSNKVSVKPSTAPNGFFSAYYSNISSINDEVLMNLQFELKQNYPNPFNNETKIEFYLPKAGMVKLSIYDILGNLIQTVSEDYRYEGMNYLKIKMSNESSGVYLYKLEFNNRVLVKKLSLLK